jgi:hypothetical protein
MKKVYILLASTLFTVGVMAQTTKAKVAKKATIAKKETVKQTPQATPIVAVAPIVDEHAGHNHGPKTTPAVVDIAKPVVEDNLGLKQSEHDFGKITQSKPVYYDFAFINTGKTELKLDNVVAGCGCTTPEWKPGPYKPNEEAIIKVGFNAGAPGPFNKTVTITYNGGASTKQIVIKGEVIPAPVTPAPENPGVQILKQ